MNPCPTLTYPEIASALERGSKAILMEWDSRVRALPSFAQGRSEPALKSSLPDLLSSLAASFREPKPSAAPAWKMPPGAAPELPRELRTLRTVLLEYLQQEAILEPRAQLALHSFIDDLQEAATAGSLPTNLTPGTGELLARFAEGGAWEANLSTHEVRWPVKLFTFLGFGSEPNPSPRDWWLNKIHPEDLERLQREIGNRLARGDDALTAEFRFLRADGTYADILATAHVVRNPAGQAERLVGNMREIGARKKDMRLRRPAEFVLDTLFNMPGLLFVIADPRGIFLEVSPAWTELLGYTAEELKARPFVEFVHPDDSGHTQAEVTRLKDGGSVESFVNRYRAKDGSYVWLQWTTQLREGVLYSFASNVTGIKETENKLRTSQERFDRVSEATGLGVWYCDLPFAELSWNKEVKEHFFLPEDARVTIDIFYDRIHPEDRELTRRAIAESNRSGERYDIEYRTTDPKDPENYRWIRAVGWTAYDGRRRPVSFDGFTLDITDTKRVEAELAESQAAIMENEQLLKLITDRLPSFVAYVDRDLNYRFLNDAYRRCFGLRVDQDKPMRSVLSPEVFERAEPNARRALAGEAVRYENTVTTIDGDQIVVDAEYLPDFHPRTGEVRGYVVVGNDITARKKAAEALEESEFRLRLALKASRIGIFDYHVKKDELLLDEQLAADWGLPAGTRQTILHAIDSLVHPDDRPLMKERLEATLQSGVPYDFELRILRQDTGEVRWVHTKAEASFDKEGRAERLTGTTVDITEKRRAKDELAASAVRFRSLTETIPQIVWSANPDGHVAWYSQQWYAYTGLPEGASWEGVMHPDDIEPTWKIYRAALESGHEYEAEYRFRGKDGHYRWFLGRAVPVRDPDGKIVQWLGTNTDINDRVETAKVLRKRSELFRLITDTIPHGVWRTNPDGSGDYFSRRFLDIVGYSLEDMLGWGWSEVIHPEDRPQVLKTWQEAREARQPVAAEFRIKSAEGRYRWFISLGNPFFDASGNLIKYYGTWTDVDERKTHAGQLQKLAETSLLLNSTRSLPEKLAELTEQSREILGAHQASLRLVPLLPGAEPVHEISYSAKYEASQGNLLDPAETGLYDLLCRLNRPVRFTQAELEANPGYRHALGKHPAPRHGFLAAPLVNGRGEPIGVIQTSDKYDGDFTESDESIFAQLAQIASAAIENAQLLEREQAAVVARDEFLSIASHELKTPLTSLKLQSQIFQRMVDKGDPRAFQPERLTAVMEQTNRQVNRLTRLVDDMLDISRIRTGKLSIQLHAAPLGDLVRESVERMLPHFRKEGMPDPVLEIAANPTVELDTVRMEQVVNNLLTNALRYGKGKPVKVSLEKRGGWNHLAVSDEGMGIEPENLDKIFDRFERAVSANEVSGLGLGLFISRQIVRAHGGRIWAESVPGRGSTFIVELPDQSA